MLLTPSPSRYWMRYEVKSDGSLGEGKVFFDASSESAVGSPDGVKVDQKGNVYGAGPGGVWIFSPEGKHLATIKFADRVANLNWGGPDLKTLYITASSEVFRIQMKIPGSAFDLRRSVSATSAGQLAVSIQQVQQSDQTCQKDAVLERKAKEFGLFFRLQARRRGCDRDALKADHFAHNSAGRVGRRHQNRT